MLGADAKALRVSWTVLLCVLGVWAVYEVRHTLIVFTLALFLSHLLAPLIAAVQKLIPRSISRTLALALVYLAIVAALVAVTVPIVSQIAEQASGLGAKLQAAVQGPDLFSSIPLPGWLAPYRDRLSIFVRDRLVTVGEDMLPLLTRIGTSLLNGLGNLFSAILIPILAFFFLKDGAEMRSALLDWFDGTARDTLGLILDDLHVLLTKYIRALVLLSLATFTSHTVALSLMGAPYTVLLAGIAAGLEFIPVIGPLLAAVTILALAGLSGYVHLAWIIGFLAAYRIFQDYVLSPYLMSSGVEVPPMLVLFGVLAGEQIAGIPGMFFSVPAIAALRIIVKRTI